MYVRSLMTAVVLMMTMTVTSMMTMNVSESPDYKRNEFHGNYNDDDDKKSYSSCFGFGFDIA